MSEFANATNRNAKITLVKLSGAVPVIAKGKKWPNSH